MRRGLPVEGGQRFPMVGVELVQDGEVAGVDMVLESNQLGVEVSAAHGLGLGWLCGKEPLGEQQRCRKQTDRG